MCQRCLVSVIGEAVREYKLNPSETVEILASIIVSIVMRHGAEVLPDVGDREAIDRLVAGLAAMAAMNDEDETDESVRH